MAYYRQNFNAAWSTRWSSWLRHCATRRKVAGSIPDCVIGIFHWHNPSGHTMALGLTKPLEEMSTRNISWGGKGGRCVGLTNLPLSCTDCLKIWEPQPPGTLRACPGLNRDCIFCYFIHFTSFSVHIVHVCVHTANGWLYMYVISFAVHDKTCTNALTGPSERRF